MKVENDTKKKKKITIEDEYQARLNIYLEEYLKENKVKKVTLAKKLGFKITHYNRIHNGESERLSKALKYMSLFSELKGISISEFVAFITAEPIDKRGSSLQPNELKILTLFSSLDMNDKEIFKERYLSNKNKFNKIIKLISLLPDFDDSTIDLLILIVMMSRKNDNLIDIDDMRKSTKNVKDFVSKYKN